MSDMTIADDVLRAKADFDAVYAKGQEVGRKAEYDAFWDVYQTNGNRTDYDLAFGGNGWTKNTFKPKYDIVPISAYMMFRKSKIGAVESAEGDLVECLEELGVKLDFSKCTNLLYIFSYTNFKRVGVIDGRASTAGVTFDSAFFGSIYLHTIDKLYLSATKPNFATNSFNGCTALVNLTLEGTIADGGLNLQWSTKLSKASIENIIEHLSTTTSGLTVTLSKTAVDTAFEGGSSGGEFHYLIDSKQNWTISLA
jgi:hypothetical protein